ncbi:MAG: hypothetical protein GF401_14520 [Chitinivibrionales bacterium]|nr:hypothetical protein [Chitinivibrionales bacterium]
MRLSGFKERKREMRKSFYFVSFAVITLLTTRLFAMSWFSWSKKDYTGQRRNVERTSTYIDTLNRGQEIVLQEKDFKSMISTGGAAKGQIPAGKKEIPNGFRVQCFASNQIDRARTEKKKLEIKLNKPVYIAFQDPYYKLLVGDFTSRNQAELILADLKNLGYDDAWIVRSKVFVTQ